MHYLTTLCAWVLQALTDNMESRTEHRLFPFPDPLVPFSDIRRTLRCERSIIRGWVQINWCSLEDAAEVPMHGGGRLES